MRDNAGNSPSDLFLEQWAKWQQRPETPTLVLRIHQLKSLLALTLILIALNSDQISLEPLER